MQWPESPLCKVLTRIGVALLIVAAIVVFLFGPKWGASRQRAMVFDGVIERKEIIASAQSRYGSSLRYVLVIRQKRGEVVRFPVPWEIYERARVGIPVHKEAGEQWPVLGASGQSLKPV